MSERVKVERSPMQNLGRVPRGGDGSGRRPGSLTCGLTSMQLFAAKVALPISAGGCWLWTASKDRRGYGYFYARGTKVRRAYRFSYERFVGPVPDGLELDHLCENPRCVNPSHLEAVTHGENLRRGRGFIGAKTRATTCQNGHDYTSENTLSSPKGHRECVTCRKAKAKRRKIRRDILAALGVE